MARAGSRAGREGGRHQHPDHRREATSRRRSAARSAAFAIEYHELARRNIDEIHSGRWRHQGPRSHRSARCSSPRGPRRSAASRGRRAQGRSRRSRRGRSAGRCGDRHSPGRLRVERGDPARRDAIEAVAGAQAELALEPPTGGRRLGDRDRALVDLLDPGRRPAASVTLGGLARRLPPSGSGARGRGSAPAVPRPGAAGRPAGPGSVHAVGDHVGVAGDVGCQDRRPCGERLGQDHAEALAGQRRGAEQVRVEQAAPQLVAVDAPERVDPPLAVGVRQMRTTSARSAPITVSARSSCSISASKAVSSTGRPLRSSGRPTKTSRSSSEPASGSSARRRRRPVRDHVVGAAEPAPPVQAAASETAIRAARWLNRRRAPARSRRG